MTRTQLQSAVRHLKRCDPVLRGIIERVGPCRMQFNRNRFAMLTKSILHQQLAVAAARTITERFCRLYGNGRGRFPGPEELLRTSAVRLRSAGVSRQKQSYLKDLARKASNGTVPFRSFSRLSDEEVIEKLVEIKGIGRWTAKMFLLFSLARPDVWAVDDLGLQLAVKQAFRLRKHPSKNKMVQVAEPWRPYRSVASWYLWQSRRLE